ncbi:MAG: Release factor glutamine methyltransferase [Parachlamydiales bacterium]|nr:Release factor glutamine methyltransferase [Parachlamydiales bacterium]
MKTIAEILPLATSYLAERKIDRARRSAEELLAFVLGVKRLDLYLQYDRPLIETEMEKMRACLVRRIKGEPIEYIMGEIDFYGCRIEVGRDVLIPRQETEIFVDLAVKGIRQQPLEGRVLWDLCSGSGCIGLGIKRACPELRVVLSDLSPRAMAVAEKNKIKNHLDVECRVGDLLQPFLNEKADFVICNPPYVSTKEYEEIDSSVRDFEPSMALLAGKRGADFYEKLSRELPSFLNPQARVFLEIGHAQGLLVQEIFNGPPWRHLRLEKDWAGHDRFFFLEIE